MMKGSKVLLPLTNDMNCFASDEAFAIIYLYPVSLIFEHSIVQLIHTEVTCLGKIIYQRFMILHL